jgi:hypothetical protein
MFYEPASGARVPNIECGASEIGKHFFRRKERKQMTTATKRAPFNMASNIHIFADNEIFEKRKKNSEKANTFHSTIFAKVFGLDSSWVTRDREYDFNFLQTNGVFVQTTAIFLNDLIIPLVFEKMAFFFAENRRKSRKTMIITLTPDELVKKLPTM